jgi:hypothetical protein
MTVEELINELKKVPKESEVFVYMEGEGYSTPVVDVEVQVVAEMKYVLILG